MPTVLVMKLYVRSYMYLLIVIIFTLYYMYSTVHVVIKALLCTLGNRSLRYFSWFFCYTCTCIWRTCWVGMCA